MNKFKVLTLNIHKGFSAGNRKFTLQKIRQCLRDSGANLVFLQEVIGENEKHQNSISEWPENNQFEYLADSVWHHFAYGKNAIYQHGHHGNAILSELPLKEWRIVDVSTLTFSQRRILHGILENGIHLLCIHFGLFESERKKQIRQLIKTIKEDVPQSAPVILAGDFNDWRGKAHAQLSEQLALTEVHLSDKSSMAKTFPAFLPMFPMDRIYTRGFSIEKVKVMTGPDWKSLSDHCAIVADVQLESTSIEDMDNQDAERSPC
jgi:endonuclease/exonuclease/phosphatase family metal-dependent hydrolase